MVKITDPSASAKMKPSVFFNGMSGTSMPIATAHGEGRASFTPSPSLSANNKSLNAAKARAFCDEQLAPILYVDNATLEPTTSYPYNPNGSPEGIAGIRNQDGRVLAMMPHPERTIMGGIGSWYPDEHADKKGAGVETWGDYGPWMRMFQSARRWVG